MLAHGAAITCIVLILPGWWMPVLGGAALAASLVFHIRRDALLLSGHSVTDVLLTEAVRCEFTLRNGTTLTGNLEDSTFVAPLLIVINISQEARGRRRAAILMPDSASREDLRRIRVWLRHRVRPDSATSGTH